MKVLLTGADGFLGWHTRTRLFAHTDHEVVAVGLPEWPQLAEYTDGVDAVIHLAGINDHITPWEACYRSALLLGGKCEFVLSNSGHIQSILNPPGNPKARYMTNSELPADPQAWLASCSKHADSWWLHWQSWVQERSGKLKKTNFNLGSKAFPPAEASPGTYVHER